MKKWIVSVCLLLPGIHAYAGGFASSVNFTVFTQDLGSRELTQDYAGQVLAKAEQCRKEVALHWFGQELPPGVGRTTISVTFSNSRDHGLTWAKDDPRRKFHVIYLTTSPDGAVGNTLAHEIAHAVMATRYRHPDRIAAWLDEGIASHYDDQGRVDARRQVLSWLARTGNCPRFDTLLSADNISARDTESYAVAFSLTEYLLTQGDRAKLLAFGEYATSHDWDAALMRFYDVRDVQTLQVSWQNWLRQLQPPVSVRRT